MADSAGSIVREMPNGTNPGLDDVLISEGIVGREANQFKFDTKRLTQPFGTRCEIAGGADDK